MKRKSVYNKIKVNFKIDGIGKIFLGKKDISQYVLGMSIVLSTGEIPNIFLRVCGDIDIEGIGKIEVENEF